MGLCFDLLIGKKFLLFLILGLIIREEIGKIFFVCFARRKRQRESYSHTKFVVCSYTVPFFSYFSKGICKKKFLF